MFDNIEKADQVAVLLIFNIDALVEKNSVVAVTLVELTAMLLGETRPCVFYTFWMYCFTQEVMDYFDTFLPRFWVLYDSESVSLMFTILDRALYTSSLCHDFCLESWKERRQNY